MNGGGVGTRRRLAAARDTFFVFPRLRRSAGESEPEPSRWGTFALWKVGGSGQAPLSLGLPNDRGIRPVAEFRVGF